VPLILDPILVGVAITTAAVGAGGAATGTGVFALGLNKAKKIEKLEEKNIIAEQAIKGASGSPTDLEEDSVVKTLSETYLPNLDNFCSRPEVYSKKADNWLRNAQEMNATIELMDLKKKKPK
jgi:hypothetical protein